MQSRRNGKGSSANREETIEKQIIVMFDFWLHSGL